MAERGEPGKNEQNHQQHALNTNSTYLSYRETGAFSRLVSDYIDQAAALQPFQAFRPDLEGIKAALNNRESNFSTSRVVLVEQLTQQYAGIDTSDKVKANIRLLSNDNAYTICTAHQPNLFTGHLYFVYKILHAVKLADTLNQEIPDKKFIPVFYMGSEDADLEELGQVTVHGKTLAWNTDQTGAVGRMKVDDKLLRLIDELHGQLSVEEHGKEIISVLRDCYTKGQTIERCTFLFVDKLFSDFGLLVLLPDNAALKTLFKDTIKKELTDQFSSKAVATTIAAFPSEYKVQAGGRDVNLFYLKDELRARIEKVGNDFRIAGTNMAFSEDEMMKELDLHPARFSPNVITRPMYQETILPNVAFIGGGAELAYWLELRSVFEQAGVAYPVLLLRNSFMILDKKVNDKILSLHLTPKDFFIDQRELLSQLVKQKSSATLSLKNEKEQIAGVYQIIVNISSDADPTLQKHVQALSSQALKRLELLEKKLLKVEKRKFDAEERQLTKIKATLFPNNTLQERIDNVMPYYAIYGKDFLQEVYDNSLGLEMKFCLLQLP